MHAASVAADGTGMRVDTAATATQPRVATASATTVQTEPQPAPSTLAPAQGTPTQDSGRCDCFERSSREESNGRYAGWPSRRERLASKFAARSDRLATRAEEFKESDPERYHKLMAKSERAMKLATKFGYVKRQEQTPPAEPTPVPAPAPTPPTTQAAPTPASTVPPTIDVEA
jgi:hypothetical protein